MAQVAKVAQSRVHQKKQLLTSAHGMDKQCLSQQHLPAS
jgi:hypothetical protein